jgi:hypothetical protein
MASRGKKKTTMGKLTREAALRDKRMDKAARRDARKQAALLGPESPDVFGEESAEAADGADGDESPEPAAELEPASPLTP